MSATHRRHASLWCRIGPLVALAGALAACGISADERVLHIPPNDIGALANTTTTTTTTTTVPPTVPATSTPESLPPETTTTTTTTTTTIAATESKDVTLFLSRRGNNDSLRRVAVKQFGEVTLVDLIFLLSNPPQELLDSGLITAVTPDLVSDMTLEPLHLVVDLEPEAFERMNDTDQNQAIAQLVLTLTSFVTPDSGAIGAVEFRVGGQPISVIIPGAAASEPGQPVGFLHFQPWIDTTGDVVTPTVPEPPATGSPQTTSPPE